MNMKVLLISMIFLRSSSNALQHFSMWGIKGEDDVLGENFVDLTFTISNISEIRDNYEKYGTKALYPLQWVVETRVGQT